MCLFAVMQELEKMTDSDCPCENVTNTLLLHYIANVHIEQTRFIVLISEL